MVAEEMPDPVRTEFKLMHDRQNFGMPIAEAMKGFAERMPILDARFFVTAVLTQRESGGNLSEVLDSLAAIIRDRFRLETPGACLERARPHHGHGALLPGPGADGHADAVAPAHMKVMFIDPIGVWITIVVVVLQMVGFYAMRRIVDIEI